MVNIDDELKKLIQCLQSICFLVKEQSQEVVIKTFVGSTAIFITDFKLNEINENGIDSGLSASDAEGPLLIALDNEIVRENVPVVQQVEESYHSCR